MDTLNATTPRPFEILKSELKRKQDAQPGYSLRALARDLKLSASYLSAVLNGTKPIPEKRLTEFARRLEMDDLSVRALKRSIARHRAPIPVFDFDGEETEAPLANGKLTDKTRALDDLKPVRLVSRRDLELWSKWYYVAVLDLSACDGFVSDIEWISRRLQIKKNETRDALDFLLRQNFLIETEGRWKKANPHLRLPCTSSRETVRSFHKQYMLKAIQVMQEQITPEEYAKRLITGIVVTANPKKIAEARAKLELALIEISRILMSGECTELYQLGMQLYPLTQPKPSSEAASTGPLGALANLENTKKNAAT